MRQCRGKRYNGETLAVRFKGKIIADVLDFGRGGAGAFRAHPQMAGLQTLADVGLGYMKLGQPAPRSPAARRSG